MLTQAVYTKKRRGGKIIAAAAMTSIIAGLFLVGGVALAVHDNGSFELDGNATNNPALPGDDWDNVCHQVLGTDCSTTNNTSGNGGATAVDWVSEPNLNATIFTGGGSKDPQDISSWAWKDGAGGLPDKDNLLHSFAARYTAPVTISGVTSPHDILYFGSDRYDNSGDAQQGFWFFQNSVALGSNSVGGGTGFTGVHKTGDVLVISDFSNGGTTSTITIYSWDPTCKKTTGSTAGTCGDANLRIKGTSSSANCGTAAANDAFCGIVNPNTITMPWSFTDKSGTPGNGALNGEFFEGGVDLTNLGLGGLCFASVASETRSSTSTTATLKDFVLGGFGHCGSTLTTQESTGGTASIGTGSVTVHDQGTVVVTGGAANNWSGSIQFHLRGPIGAANEASTDIGLPVAVSNGTPTVNSIDATVTAAGDYCWTAHFTSGTSGVPDADDTGDNECFTITPVTPTLSTQAGAGPVVLGGNITDTATLSGTSHQPGTPAINPTTAGAAAGGSITFTAYGPNDCTTVAFTSSAVGVTGDNTYGPVSFKPTAVGTYHWVATYTPATGDPNNVGSTHNSDCSDTNEDVTVTSVASSMTSAQSFIPNDSATVSAPQGGNLAGSMKFEVFESNDCSGTAIYTQTVSVAGASPQSVHTTNTATSTTASSLSWRLTYTSTNPAQRSIAANCFETSSLTISNGGTISSQ
jgi:hypothetical protein